LLELGAERDWGPIRWRFEPNVGSKCNTPHNKKLNRTTLVPISGTTEVVMVPRYPPQLTVVVLRSHWVKTIERKLENRQDYMRKMLQPL